ncbi:MAG: c-type cytochrome, partial [Paracoccaceae bacterium]
MKARAAIAALSMLCGPLGGPPAAAQEYAPGEKLTMINCGRCHKVSEKDRMGGIGSTPSFAVMRTWD